MSQSLLKAAVCVVRAARPRIGDAFSASVRQSCRVATSGSPTGCERVQSAMRPGRIGASSQVACLHTDPWRGDDSANATETDDARPDAFDSLIQRLHRRRGRMNDSGATRGRPDNDGGATRGRPDNDGGAVRDHPEVKVEVDEAYDTQLSMMLADAALLGGATVLFRESCARDVYPSFETMQRLVVSHSKQGALHEIDFVGSVCSAIYPAKHRRALAFQHYVAEAHGHNGRFAQSMRLFGALYRRHVASRGKIANLSKFVMAKIVRASESSGGGEGDDPVDHALAFAELCRVCSGSLRPASNLWKLLLLSRHPSHRQLADRLPDDFPGLHEAICEKLRPLCDEVLAQNRADVLYRLVSVVEHRKMADHKPMVFNGLMQLYCDNSDLEGAAEVFWYAQKNNIRLSADAVKSLVNLYYVMQKSVPIEVLQQKYNYHPAAESATKSKPPGFSF
ncbi:PREDICTED: uncharacterized protein LOC106821628 [Priapulus caudatus]|uniref:Uncharacterized protein LOC106821628 n=1 Tax=Priapulus caudatus TaxID=37621 RepID=A0ABM1FC34_PRICU|nr:PREDICTED: uncharacterized protein LOC106821628 [Priapulus caudatus]